MMKRQVKGFISGFVLAAFLTLGISANAAPVFSTIQVAENAINIKVNGVLANVPNFVVDGRTYIQLRSISELLNKNVSWDPNTNVAGIDDKTSVVTMSQTDNSAGSVTEQVAKHANAVVMIQTFDNAGIAKGQGSGFIISPDGEILTNDHVVNGVALLLVTTFDHQIYKADVVKENADQDVALIKLRSASNLPVVALGDSSGISLGETVVAIGNPEGLQGVVSDGIVSTVRRSVNGKSYIQTTAPISPGSSGGALFNAEGQVIGITTAQLTEGELINLAVPINFAKQLLQ